MSILLPKATFLAGGIAGFTVDSSLYAIDTWKTRAQSIRKLQLIAKNKSIFSGLCVTSLTTIPCTGFYMSVYENVKQTLQRKTQKEFTGIIPVVAACVAITTTSIFRTPMELIKQKMQVGLYSKAFTAFKNIYRQGGIRGFYSGVAVCLLRDVPFDCIEFLTYESQKQFFFKSESDEMKTYHSLLMGGVSGAFAGFLTNPIDMLKTRIMTQTGEDGKSVKKPILRTAAKLYREEGARAFLHGAGQRVLWLSLGGAIFFFAYENSKALIQRSVIPEINERA